MHDAMLLVRLLVDVVTGGDPAVPTGADGLVVGVARVLSLLRDLLLTILVAA